MPKKQFLFLALCVALFLLAISCFFLMDVISDKAGNCIDFDGRSYVLIRNKNAKFNGPALTLDGWIYFEELSGLGGIASVYSSRDNKRVWALIQKEGEQICFLTSQDGVSITQANWKFLIPAKQWIYLGLTYSNGEAVLYVNGKQKGRRRAVNDLFLCDQEFVLGAFNRGGFLKGRMDEVRLWGKVLDEEEIQGLMCSSVIGEEPGLIAAYSFDGQRSGILYDKKRASNGKYISLIPESMVKSDAPVKVSCIKKNEGRERSIISGTEPPQDFHVWFEGPSSIGLKWGKIQDVDSYLIYRSEFNDEPFQVVGEVNNTEFLDFNLRRSHEFYYKIACVVGNSRGKKSKALKATTNKTLNDLAFKNIKSYEVTYPYRFIVMGDSHVKAENTDDDSINVVFKRHLKAIQILDPKPLFMVIVGDFTDDGLGGDYLTYSNLVSRWMAETGISVFSVPGNHDLQSENGFEYYSSFIGDLDYFYDWGIARFVCVNNVQHPGDQPGWDNLNYRIDESQMAFLEKVLDVEMSTKFVFCHIPISRDDTILKGCSEFKNILNKHNVTACWQGHWHGFNRFVLDGVRGIVSGGGGGEFHEPIITKKSLNMFNDRHHFLVVDIYSNGEVFVDVCFSDDIDYGLFL